MKYVLKHFRFLKDLGIFMTNDFCNCFEHMNFLVVMSIKGKGMI